MRIKRKEKKERLYVTGYDYSTKEKREDTVNALFARAKAARTAVEMEWKRCNDYYNFAHDISRQMVDFSMDKELPFVPPVIPDPWIIVESQINPKVPEPEFHGRDDDQDSEKAKMREYAVRYIVENNRLEDMNTRNERRLLKLGDAFWKAYWDPTMRCGMSEGDIRVKDIPVESIFPDPAIRDGQLQDGQYVDYVYSLHKVAFIQMFKRELDEMGISASEILSADYIEKSGLFDMTTAVDDQDDTIQILEHWFRQPIDTEDAKAGDIGCSIQAGGRELRYIPCYWERTGKQNKLFPFVHYWRIQDENRFWNKSELFPVLDMVDAADRKLSMALYNDAMLANDIIIAEEDAFADGCEPSNEPGAIWTMKQNRSGAVARLGGLHPLTSAMNDLNWFKEQIERANRNYESNMGKNTSNTQTATGLAMLRSDANAQGDIKAADRLQGFERLYELLDWLALEFFDDQRMLFIGAKDERPAATLMFHADSFAQEMPEVLDIGGEVIREKWTYFPRVDVTITAGDSVIKGKQATLQALQGLAQANITPQNWKLFAAQLEILDIPNKKEIVEEWKKQFEMQAAPMGGGGGPMPQESAMQPEMLDAMRQMRGETPV